MCDALRGSHFERDVLSIEEIAKIPNNIRRKSIIESDLNETNSSWKIKDNFQPDRSYTGVKQGINTYEYKKITKYTILISGD